MVAISSGVTDRLRYVMIVSIPETIKHQNMERKSFLKKNCGEADNPKFDQRLPVNGYGIQGAQKRGDEIQESRGCSGFGGPSGCRVRDRFQD